MFSEKNKEKMADAIWVALVLAAAVLAISLIGRGSAFSACADVVKVEIEGAAIVEGVWQTTNRDIEVQIVFENRADWYVMCEDPEFKDCDWKRVPMFGPIKFRLSEGSGVKKIFFRAKRGSTYGAPASFTVELVES